MSVLASYLGGKQAAKQNAMAAMLPQLLNGSPMAAMANMQGPGGAAPAFSGQPGGSNQAPDFDGEWLKYSNQGATRNDPLDPKLVDAMSFLPGMGVSMNVISGGQEAAGEGGSRTGSTRHDHGMAADVDFYKDGRKLDWNNPADMPLLTQIVQTAKARGVTGIGAGDDYMGAGRFHVGFGNPGVWGAGGKGANAPEWLVSAYNNPLASVAGM